MAKSKGVIPFTCWAFILVLKVLNWSFTISSTTSDCSSLHMKSSFPLCTFNRCCTDIRHSRVGLMKLENYSFFPSEALLCSIGLHSFCAAAKSKDFWLEGSFCLWAEILISPLSLLSSSSSSSLSIDYSTAGGFHLDIGSNLEMKGKNSLLISLDD